MKTSSSVHELHQKTLSAARAEKAATFALLACLHEIERTSAHLELGYPSLFAYVHEALGYSESQSYERMGAMRLAFKSEPIRDALASGALTMTAVARVGSHARKEKWSGQKTEEVALSLLGASVRTVERKLADETPAPAHKVESVKPVAFETTEIKLQVGPEFIALLEEARRLHANPAASLTELFQGALEKWIAHQKKQKGIAEVASEKTALPRTSGVDPHSAPASTPTPVTGVKTATRYIPVATRRALYRRSHGRCEYTDPKTQKRCASPFGIQIEHREPWAHGGANTPANLAHFCRAHNQHAARRVFGEWSQCLTVTKSGVSLK